MGRPSTKLMRLALNELKRDRRLPVIFQQDFLETLMSDPDTLLARTQTLEKRLRRTELALFSLLLVAAGGVVAACTSLNAQTAGRGKDEGILRVRGIVVTDANGVERMHIGAPLPNPPGAGERVSDATGILIHDPNGRERVGLGVLDNGAAAIGFDAPSKPGHKNSERLHVGVTPDGRGFIRFLDRQAILAGMMQLDEKENVGLEFWNAKQDGFRRSRLDIDGWRKLPDQKKTE
jgi:hypothetical protein